MLKKRKRSLPLLIVNVVATVLCCGLFSASLLAANYVSIDIPGATDVHPVAVNGNGQVVGYFYENGLMRGFLRNSDGAIEVLAYGANTFTNTFVHDVNKAGEIIAEYGNPTHAVLRSPDGTVTKIDPPGATWATAIAINSHGAVVGTSPVGFYIRARNGKYTMFSAGWPCGINDSGVVAGQTREDLGFVRAADGTVTLFEPPAQRYDFMPKCLMRTGMWWDDTTAKTRAITVSFEGQTAV